MVRKNGNFLKNFVFLFDEVTNGAIYILKGLQQPNERVTTTQ